MKKCKKCEINKELNEFHKDRNLKSGHMNVCKDCRRLHQQKNADKIKTYKKKYREEHREEIKDNMKEYREKNSEEIRYYSKKYACENKEEKNERSKQYYYKNKKRSKELNKIWINKNKKRIRELNKKYYSINKIKNKHIITWRKLLESALRRMGKIKNKRTINMLGYTPGDLKSYMESLFIEGMSWRNHGEWHIDHKIPLNAFNPETPMSIVNSLENLQPLWAKDNMSKGNKILEEYKSMDIYIKYCI